MDRRSLLHALAGATTAGLAGCFGDSAAGPAEQSQTASNSPQTEQPTDGHRYCIAAA